MKGKEFLKVFFIFVIGSIILTAIISPQSLSNLTSSVGKINIGGNSDLDIIQDPQEHIGGIITLKNMDLCVDKRIIDFKPDGNEVYLRYYYPDQLNSHYRYDLTGQIELTSNSGGDAGYLFVVENAIQRKYVRDFEGGSWFNCDY